MITVTISNFAKITSPAGLQALRLADEIKGNLTFVNPKWASNERLGYWNGRTPRELKHYWLDGDSLQVPRGYTRQLLAMLRPRGMAAYKVVDRRRTLPDVSFSFGGELRDYQREAIEAFTFRDFGVLAAPTGSGKTCMALAMVSARRQPALIVVHTAELLNQWVDRIGAFLGIPASEVGVIGGGRLQLGERVTVGLVQSLFKCAAEVAPRIGFLIVDECHRAPARTFTEAVTAFDCKYMLGLSATPWRRDGLSRLIYWYLGDKVHEIDRAALIEAGHIMKAEAVFRHTDFIPQSDPKGQYTRMLNELADDQARHELIVADVVAEARNGGGVCLVLTDRKSHCETLRGMLQGEGIEAAVLTGDLKQAERAGVVARLTGGEVRVLIATGQLVGEGFDLPALSTLFLVTPVKFSGRVLQYLGRVLRPLPGKEQARIYDYVDPVGVLQAAAKARARVYRAQGAKN